MAKKMEQKKEKIHSKVGKLSTSTAKEPGFFTKLFQKKKAQANKEKKLADPKTTNSKAHHAEIQHSIGLAKKTAAIKKPEANDPRLDAKLPATPSRAGFFSKVASFFKKKPKETVTIEKRPEAKSNAKLLGQKIEKNLQKEVIAKEEAQIKKDEAANAAASSSVPSLSQGKQKEPFLSKMKGLFVKKISPSEAALDKVSFLRRKKKRDKIKRPLVQERRYQLKSYLDKAGISLDPKKIGRRIFDFAVLLNLCISAYAVYIVGSTRGYTLLDVILGFLFIWTVVLGAIMVIAWVLLYVFLDLRIYNRKMELEEVLPDYLQLTASNIKAGMTIDRALWYAVRPRFGVLANEIEMVAKETMRGVDLKDALQMFANKYDSPLLKRSMSLLIEGIESGGEIGTLLNKISINIQENKIMKREMAANVSTYVIFISFATIAAAPGLFALSGVLIRVISSLGGAMGDSAGSGVGGFAISFSGSGIEYGDFKIFAIVSLIISSFFASMIIATIMKGNAKAGIKYIPIFIISTLLIFLTADFVLGKFVGFIH